MKPDLTRIRDVKYSRTDKGENIRFRCMLAVKPVVHPDEGEDDVQELLFRVKYKHPDIKHADPDIYCGSTNGWSIFIYAKDELDAARLVSICVALLEEEGVSWTETTTAPATE